MAARSVLLVFGILALAGVCLWYFLEPADPEPAFIVEEPEQVLTGVVANMGEQHQPVTYRIRNQTRRWLRVVGTSGES
jgi:hypothetical protein